MILLIHTNEINLKNHLYVKNIEKLETIGEMNFQYFLYKWFFKL